MITILVTKCVGDSILGYHTEITNFLKAKNKCFLLIPTKLHVGGCQSIWVAKIKSH